MNIVNSFVSLVIFSLIICGSTANAGVRERQARKDIKEAIKSEKRGLVEAAANQYLSAMEKGAKLKDKEIKKALAGLRRTASAVVNDMIRDIESTQAQKEYRAVIARYSEVQKYLGRIARTGIKLKRPAKLDSLHKDARTALAFDYYNAGKKSLEQEHYKEAYYAFGKALATVSNYQDAVELQAEAHMGVAFDYYNAGKKSLEQEHYKEAYYAFGKALATVSNYQDATELQAEARKSAEVVVGIFPAKNTTTSIGIEAAIQPVVLDKLLKDSNPFLVFVDRSNLVRLLGEQNLGVEGIVDEQTAVKIGKVIGLDRLVLITIYEVIIQEEDEITEQEQFYEVVNKTMKKYPNGLSRYYYTGRPALVNVHNRYNKVHISAQVQIISTETSQILEAKLLTGTIKDGVQYAECGGCNWRILSPRNPEIYNPTSSEEELYNTPVSTTIGALLVGIRAGVGNFSKPPDLDQRWIDLFPNQHKRPKSTFHLKKEAQNILSEEVAQALLKIFRQ